MCVAWQVGHFFDEAVFDPAHPNEFAAGDNRVDCVCVAIFFFTASKNSVKTVRFLALSLEGQDFFVTLVALKNRL